MSSSTDKTRQAAASKNDRVARVVDEVNVRWVAIAVAFLAATGLGFQLTLTRVFSLIFQYHFVFLVVSLGILGLGLGAAAGYLALQTGFSEGRSRTIVTSALALAISFPVVAVLLTTINSQDQTLFAALVALVPFFLLGWFNALIYQRYSKNSNLIYGADLTGAASGLVTALLLLTWFGPFGAILVMGALAAIAALLLALAAKLSRLLQVAAVTAVVLAALAIANGPLDLINYRPENITNAAADKTLVAVLQNPEQSASVIATAWGPFAQVHVVETADTGARFVFTDAGAGSIMIRDDSQVEDDFAWLEREVPYLPFEVGPVENTLIIGSGAGYDIFMARHAGAEAVTAVEVNPAIVAITRQQAEYNGNILDLPGVETIVTDGRNFVDRSDDTYDLIYLNIVYSQAAAPSTSSLAENHIFTVEAMRSYWQRLDEDGRIAFVAHNGGEGRRLFLTALKALEAESLAAPDAMMRLAMVQQDNRYNDPTGQAWPTVLFINRQPWSEDEAAALVENTDRRNMLNLFVPHFFDESLFYNELRLVELMNGELTLDEYINLPMNQEPRAVAPTTDDQPFFYYLNPGLPDPIEDFLQFSGLLTFGFFLVVAFFQPKEQKHEWTRTTLALYFALLGAGFLLVEVAVQQRFKLLLGDPVISLAVTLGALLLGGGLGSFFGQRFRQEQLPRLVAIASLAAAGWLVAALFLYPALVEAALPLPLLARMAVTLIAVLPLGFLLGIPFPGGLRLAGDADPTGIPLYWAMNALSSTLGAVVATVAALLVGFQAALLFGALLYLLVAALVQFTWSRVGIAPS